MAYTDEVSTARDTFMTTIEIAHNRLTDFADRLQRVADQLCGPTPEVSGANGKLHSIPTGGLFDVVAERGRDMSDKLERCNNLMQRIERSLP